MTSVVISVEAVAAAAKATTLEDMTLVEAVEKEDLRVTILAAAKEAVTEVTRNM